MNAKPTNTQRAARAAARHMADRDTPFIYNEWYVAGFSEEFGHNLTKRTLLGKGIVFYRKAAGAVVALRNRCAHRAFPLSESILDGDTIVCAYHGLRYDETGKCVEVPATGQKKMKGLCVPVFPIVEQNPLVWIWMGDPQLADRDQIPKVELMSSQWRYSRDYIHLGANYVYLHENLLDLTHLSYLHRNTFGTPDFASAPYETKIDDDEISITRSAVPTTLPPIWADTTGIVGENQGARITQSKFVTPGLQLISARFYDVTLNEGERPDQRIITAHIPTPETKSTTHYFVMHGRNFARDNDAITDHMHSQLMKAFQEDVVALAAQEEVLANSDDKFGEISVPTDAPGIAMRRLIKRRSDCEHRPSEQV